MKNEAIAGWNAHINNKSLEILLENIIKHMILIISTRL